MLYGIVIFSGAGGLSLGAAVHPDDFPQPEDYWLEKFETDDNNG